MGRIAEHPKLNVQHPTSNEDAGAIAVILLVHVAITLSLLYIPLRCAICALPAQRILGNVRVGQEKRVKIFLEFQRRATEIGAENCWVERCFVGAGSDYNASP